MRPAIPTDLLDRAREWDELHRWERSELGKALRRLGLTYGEIRELIPVPKATLSYWCRDIRLTDEQVEAIRERVTDRRTGIPVDTQWRRREAVQSIRGDARKEVPLLLADPRWTAGTVLYWAEGAKTKSQLAMANSDPEVLKIFVAWTRLYHNPDAEFTLALHLHEGNDEPAARRYWSSQLELPHAKFTKTFIKQRGTGHRKNRLAWGVCRVVVRRSGDFHVRTMAWIEALRGQLS